MKTFATVAALAPFMSSVLAQASRPANESICDFYTSALLGTNNATNQYTLLTLVVNTAVIGNYTKPNVGIAVAGILAPGMVNGTAVNLLPYFDGGFASTNQGGSSGVAVNFLDGGGAAPLMKNMPANDNTSNQYRLLTHLYQYFGALLGCSAVDYPAYMGDASQYQIHKFMDLNYAQTYYFIEQVGLAAASFGVATADVEAVGMALGGLFAERCAPPVTVIPAQGAQLQAVCIADDCPLSPNATCAAYAAATMPAVANATLVGNATATGSMPSASSFKGAAEKLTFGLGAGLFALAAFLL